MKNPFAKLFKDLENENLPLDIDNVDKINCELESGKRIYWYYKEDKSFFADEGEDVKEHYRDIFSGIIVPSPDTEINHGELDFGQCVIVIDQYPVEKEYCEVDWTALKRLLDDDDLVEIFEVEKGSLKL